VTNPDDEPAESSEVVPLCPICDAGEMVLTRRLHHMHLCVCLTCGTTLSVPEEALTSMRQKKNGSDRS
jgi:hypothetical protein